MRALASGVTLCLGKYRERHCIRCRRILILHRKGTEYGGGNIDNEWGMDERGGGNHNIAHYSPHPVSLCLCTVQRCVALSLAFGAHT